MPKASENSKGNAQIHKVGHTQGQLYGTSATAQPPIKNNPMETKLK